MTPQSTLMVVAPIEASREAELRHLLARMNSEVGVADPGNPLLPFSQFSTLHFARFVILDDATAEDLRAYGADPLPPTKSLAFLCDCDGPADHLRGELAKRAGDGLRKIFSCCLEFPADCDLEMWMEEHDKPAATAYTNWLGRTVMQVLEENDLRSALVTQLQSSTHANASPQQVWRALQAFVASEQRGGRLVLTPPSPTPWRWRIKDLLHLFGVPLLLLLVSPLLLLYLPFFLIQLRLRESKDAEIVPRADAAFVKNLASREDRILTNQFSAYGNLKPGTFRRWTLIFLLFAVNYTTRHIYNRGFLARVNTIHFARWVFLDNRKRLFFASNYDGSLESYMGDFINKVAWGLNLVFSNGVGYPKTYWLVLDGAKDEQKFKDYIRRHQLPSEVWYDATPGITAFDMERNSRIRDGIEEHAMTDAEVAEWVKLF